MCKSSALEITLEGENNYDEKSGSGSSAAWVRHGIRAGEESRRRRPLGRHVEAGHKQIKISQPWSQRRDTDGGCREPRRGEVLHEGYGSGRIALHRGV